MEEVTCMLCCNVEPYVGLGECSHGPICYKCSYKMRLISKNLACPICKVESKVLIIATEPKEFGTFNLEKMLSHRSYPGFMFESKHSMELFQKLTEYRCSVPECGDDKTFTSIALLKKHMKERHSRFFCDICLEYKTCVLEEHRMYSSKALDRHMKKGDIDESGNTTFLHPYCKFCTTSFFDEDFLRKHLTREHYTCTICPEKYKYYHYKDYKGLEIHFRMTHYLCPDQDCIAKGFIAFKKQSDLMAHRFMHHEKSTEKKPTDFTAAAGFFTEGSKLEMDHIKLEDKEGVDFEMEFLSLRKTKMRAISDEVDQHKDEEFDFRIFLKQRYDDDELFQQVFEKGDKDSGDNRDNRKEVKGNKKYKIKGEAPQPSQESLEKPNDQQKPFLETILASRTVHSPPLEYKEFEQKLHIIFTQEQYEKFSEMKHLYYKNKLSAEEFMSGYLKLFKPAGLQTAFNVWPQFIRTVQNQETKYELDAIYLKTLKNTLPKKSNSLINTSNRYSDFLNTLLEIIEEQLEKRIESGALSIRKKVRMDKERIFQMIEVIRHVKTPEMARLKFGTNFGISPETIHMMEAELYSVDAKNACSKLSSIPEFELLNLYLFVKFCRNALTKKDIHLEKRMIKEEILEEFLERRPELVMKYGKRKESMTLDEQAEFEEEQEKKVKEKTMIKLAGFQKKAPIVDHEDKYDFPDLNDKKVQVKKVEMDKATMPTTNEQYKETFAYEKTNKPATLKKNLNEFFPSLGSDSKKPENPKPQSKPEATTIKTEPDKQKPWWTKVEGKQEEQPEEGKLQGEIRREKKKKKEIIYVQGGFK